MFHFTLPLTIEEQAIMKLYDALRGHIRDTVGDHEKSVEAIFEVVNELSRCVEEKKHLRGQGEK